MPTPHWSPASILDLDLQSSSACIGHAKTQGRRCRNPIAYANRQEAQTILLQMARLDPWSPRVECELEELASRLLCRRWHQDQAALVKGRWQRRIENYRVAEAARRAERRVAVTLDTGARARAASAAREGDVTLVTALHVQISFSLTVSMVIGEESSGRDSNTPDEETSRRQLNSIATSIGQQEAAPQRISQEPNDSAPLLPPNEHPTHTPTISPQDRPTAANEAEASQTTLSPPTGPPQSPQNSDPQPRHHEHRPVEGDCSICLEDLIDDSGITWCRAQCGQIFHAECITAWHASLETEERAKTCPYCRTEWVE